MVVDDIEHLFSIVWILLIVFYERKIMIHKSAYVCFFHFNSFWKLFLQKYLDSSSDNEILVTSIQTTKVEGKPFSVLYLFGKNWSYDNWNEFSSCF